MRLLIYIILPLLILSALILPESHSQVPADSKGTEFWLTFPPNYHNNRFQSPALKYRDSLYIFIAADEPTNGSIYYYDSDTTEHVRQFSISDPKDMYVFSNKYQKFSLNGYLEHNIDIPIDQNEIPAPQHFRIVTDKDVAVYAQNQAETTSDALLVYPKDALGMKYRIMSYHSDSFIHTPSQFAILATEDNTTIKIRVTAPTHATGLDNKIAFLDAGESFLVQADSRVSSQEYDLTGSYIESDKPIAVFAGHQRATVPSSSILRASRDHLIQQMIPLETWGTNAFIIPFADASGDRGDLKDIYRIVAA
ncbi:MAG: IgGFc-binding protein, partial [Bacteroidota bacterium]